MKSIKHILTSIAVLVGFVCQAQNPVDSLVVPVATADSLTVPQEYSDIYLDTVKENKDTQTTPDIEGATQAIIDVAELPFMAHMHIDGLHYKVMADLGIYAGYRLGIRRTGDNVDEAILNSFLETDRRLDYGICGGLGFGLVFDPVEFHINANLRYSWGTIYDPDYVSKDYYRFAYPFDVVVTAGVYFQLTRRTGRNKAQLRREAYQQVYNPTVK